MSIPGAASPLFLATTAGAADAFEISRSLRFNSADTPYLNRTPSSASNRKTWTWSAWVKKARVGEEGNLFTVGASSTEAKFRFNSNDTLEVSDGGGGQLTTAAVFRDTSAWYHIVVLLDNTQATAANRFKLYINGSEAVVTGSPSSQNTDGDFNKAVAHYIGRQVHNTANLFNGYLAEINFIDGSALDPTSFAQADSDGVWKPKDTAGLTFGTNGFRLQFADNSGTTATTLGKDTSGNSNNFTPSNLFVSGFDYTGTGSYTASQFYPDAGQPANVFNGNSSSYAFGNNQGSPHTATFTFGTPKPVAQSNLKIRAFKSDANGRVFINGTDMSSYLNAQSSGGLSTVDVSASFSFPLTITSFGVENMSNNSGALAQIFVDNAELIDGSPANIDSLVDTPSNGDTASDTGAGGEITGCYATLNPLDNSNGLSLSNGNLEAENTNASNKGSRLNFKFPSSGKWYIEATALTLGGNLCLGVSPDDQSATVAVAGTNYILINSSGSNVERYSGESNVSYSSAFNSYSTGAILQIAYDADSQKLWFGLNNQWMDSGTTATGNPSSGSNPTLTSITNVFPSVSLYTSKIAINAGQRSFSYAAPTGFKSLNTANLPTPTIADGSLYFDTKLWTGNSGSRSFTGFSFSPSLLWTKIRSAAYNHVLFDAVRGVGVSKELESDTNRAEGGASTNAYGYVSAFNADGFSTTAGSSNNYYFNQSGQTYVSWAWAGGTSTVTNNDGSIASQVRVNQTAGFSIVTYTGVSGNQSFGHGLNVKPKFISIKNRSNSANWFTMFDTGATHYQYGHLNDTTAFASATAQPVTNSTITYGNNNSWFGAAGDNYIAYCFAPVEGYSAIGTYQGNGNADGPFIYTGFKIAWLLVRPSSTTGNWAIIDTARDPYNTAGRLLLPNDSSAEIDFTSSFPNDILSNGFKLRNTGGQVNASGTTYVYLAFASHPFASNGGLAR